LPAGRAARGFQARPGLAHRSRYERRVHAFTARGSKCSFLELAIAAFGAIEEYVRAHNRVFSGDPREVFSLADERGGEAQIPFT
jgi:hypothetical protein